VTTRPAREELGAWAGLLFAAAVFVGLGIVGRAWHPQAGMPLEPPWFRTPDALFAAVDALGPVGRSQHRVGVLTLDTLIPLSYGWAMYRAARFYLGRLGGPPSLAWLPVAAMLCDFAENACIVALLGAHPTQPHAVAIALLAFAWTKWILLVSAAIGIIYGWVVLRRRASRSPAA
jgi:hypothetical protein